MAPFLLNARDEEQTSCLLTWSRFHRSASLAPPPVLSSHSRRNHGTSTREGAEGRNRAEDDPDSTHDADPTLAPTHAAVPATSTQNGNDNTNGLATASKVALEEERAKHQAVGEGAASGTVHVVTTTPGSEWFAETFLGRLGL